ncbi:MAG TPA: hypothetical protein VFH68_05340 [Polyangia bacterium]|nr:hypothetical protein [Polyangia bacterium]
MVLFTGWTVGACANVTFVDAPFAPRKIDLLYSVQEDITAIRWRVAATEPDPQVRFELLDADGEWQPVDFASSVYQGGVTHCADKKGGLCGQMVVRGRYRPPDDAPSPLRSRNPTYDLSPGDQPTLHDYVQTLSLKTYFSRNNLGLVTTISDVIGGDPTFVFPRPLEGATWERRGVCIPGYFPADAHFTTVTGLKEPWASPAPLSADGFYCAAVRPVMVNGERGTDFQLAIDTVPEVANGDRTYTVKTENTPFSYQIVLDLSIPVADRCQEAIQLIQALVAENLGKFSALRALPMVDLSATDPETHQPGIPCRQSPLRALDGSALAQQVKTSAATWEEKHPRYFLLYFNNLHAPLPDPLTRSLGEFMDTLANPAPPGEFVAQLWPFGPDEMVKSFGGWGTQVTPWSTAKDPGFALELAGYGATKLPLVSEIQDPKEPLPILKEDQAPALDGGWLRLCQISITPLQGTGLQLVTRGDSGPVYLSPSTEYQVKGDNPPQYLLTLPPVWAVPSPGFTPHEAYIRYEVCTRYCTHPFTSESGAPVTSGWIGSALCVGPPSGGTG